MWKIVQLKDQAIEVNNLVNNYFKLWEHLQVVLEANISETWIQEVEKHIVTTKQAMSTLPPTNRKEVMRKNIILVTLGHHSQDMVIGNIIENFRVARLSPANIQKSYGYYGRNNQVYR